MTLAERLSALATRLATEVNLLRSSGFKVIAKPTDTARSNTIVSAVDPHLFLAVTPGTYRVRVYAVFDTTANADAKYNLTMNGGAASQLTYRKHNIAGAAAGTDLFTEAVAGAAVGDQSVLGTGTGPVWVEIDALVVVTQAGTLEFRWAQGSSHAQACTLKAGSYMDWLKVA